MGKKHAFSLYDVEEFLRDAGATRVNEKAVISFEQELENTLNELLNEAEKYANYAGRSRLIKRSDIKLLKARAGRIRRRKAVATIAAQRGTAASFNAKANITNAASITHI